MAMFIYNNVKNTNTGYTSFELNCNYPFQMLYEEKVDPRSKSKSANELSVKLKKLMIVCWENLHYALKLQK